MRSKRVDRVGLRLGGALACLHRTQGGALDVHQPRDDGAHVDARDAKANIAKVGNVGGSFGLK